MTRPDQGGDAVSDGNGGYNFLAGFFVGAALGAMAALLLTPKTGKEMRETLAEESKKLKSRTEGAVSDIRTRGEEAYDKAREAVSEGTERAREAISETREGVKKAAQAIKKS
jgi:gas vesicle protein